MNARPSSPLVLVTGASSGIGRATAIRLLRSGARVILVARRADALGETVALAGDGCGDRAWIHPCDVGDRAELLALVATVRDEHGVLDALVNNAGVSTTRTFEADPDFTDADRIIDVNFRAPLALVHAFADQLVLARGTIVNVSSVAGLVGTPSSPVYSATKWGLTGFSEALRARYEPFGVRVVCVHPGPVPTPGWRHERLERSKFRRVLASDVDAIALCIDRAIRGRGSVAPVRPRTYAILPTMRGLAPWLVRWLLKRSARYGPAPASRTQITGTSQP